MEAISVLLDPAIFLPSLLASLLAAVACGVTGPLVVSRRLVFLAGAIAHVAVGGIGVAIYFGWDPVLGALAAAVVGAVVLSVFRLRAHEHLDTMIGALWAVGMAVGLILVKLTPGYHVELLSYLFGYLPAADWQDVQVLLALDVVLVITVLATFKRLVAVGLDVEHVRLQGLSVWASDLLLLVLVALTVVALTRVVGLILVISLISLPAATAGRFTSRLPAMIALSTVLAIFLVVVPRVLVYGTPVAPEPAIVVGAGLLYASVVGLGALRR
jgi:zinc transport system permease protein